MTSAPLSGPDLYFYRGQFCGLRVKGAPVVAGSNASNPECVMAALLDNYPDWVVEEFLRLYCGYGYTHLQRSLSHALYYVGFERFKAVSRKAQGVGLFLDVWFIANEFPGFQFNQDASFWKPLLDPYIDALLGEWLIDQVCPCWQMDQIMNDAPGNATISIIAYVADRMPQSVPIYTHWIRDAMAWWKTGGETWNDAYQSTFVHDRFSWWTAMQPYLTGGHYQGDTHMARTDPATYQGHIRDTLNPFNDGRMGLSQRNGRNAPFAITNFECSAQDQFDGTCGEDEGDLVGFIHTCTISDGSGGVMAGYGNGARMPDGKAL
ncbi:MAG: hypothetical protein V4529_17130 [Gemmatimonadota bacterium]